MIELTIDGKNIAVEPGTTILEAALQNGLYIPNMCYDRRLRPYGGCRLCVVEVEGQPRLFAACSSPVTPGMIVHTETPKLAKCRRTVLELMLLHHPLDCPVCDKAGECALQDLTFKYGSSQTRFFAERKHDPERLDAPIVERNINRCILCGKCVRVCFEHQGVGAIELLGRGFETKVSPAFEEKLDCEFCGQCVDACPVGALGTRHYRHKSRVWYMDEYQIVCPFCGCGCTTNVSLRDEKIIRARGREGVGINEGNLCSKGRFGFDYIYSENRLTTPLIRKDGQLEPASWEEAFSFIAGKLQSLRERYGPGAIGAIGSQRCTIEDGFVLQTFMREVIGSDNIDSAARFGYAKTQQAVEKVFGLDQLPIVWKSPLSADFILVVESDITSTLPVWGLNFIHAKQREAELVVADSKKMKLSRLSSRWHRIRPGTGVVLLNGIMKVIVDENLFPRDKVSSIADFNAFIGSISGFTPAFVAEQTGIPEDEIIGLARNYAAAGKRLLALTSNASENTKSLSTLLAAANLVLLMGDAPETLQIPAEFSNTLGTWMAGVRPLGKGKDVYEMLYKPGSVKALYIMGENPLVALPDVNTVEHTLKGLEFLVVQDIFLTDTAKRADVVLPACSWAEKEGSFMSATGQVQRIPKLVPEKGDARPDWKIVAGIAAAMGQDLGFSDIQQVRAAVSDLVVSGLAGEVKPSFAVANYQVLEQPDESYPMVLATSIILQHSGSLSALSKNLDSVVSDAYLQINTVDAQHYGIRHEDFVRVTSRRGEVILKAIVSDEVTAGTVFAPIHFAHVKVNTLTYPSLDGGIPLVAVKIQSL